MFGCTKCTEHLTKWIDLFLHPWGPLENLIEDKHIHSQGQNEICSHWDKVIFLYYIHFSAQWPPQGKKLCFLATPISKALTSYSKSWFCWLHKLLRTLFKRQIPRPQLPRFWLGKSGEGPRNLHLLQCRFRHKLFTDLLAQGLRHNLNLAFKFWLYHRIDTQLQANFEIYLNIKFLIFKMGVIPTFLGDNQD